MGKIVYCYRFDVPPNVSTNEPQVIKQEGIWPSCLLESWKTGDAFPTKSSSVFGGWDLEEKTCSCGRHVLQSRKTSTQNLYMVDGSNAGLHLDILVQVIEKGGKSK